MSGDAWLNLALGALIGVLVTVAAHFMTKRSRELVWLTDKTVLIRDLKPQVSESVVILFDGMPIEDLSVTKLYVWNKGRAAIRREDISQTSPLLIRCTSEILSAEIVAVSRPSLDATIRKMESKTLSLSFSYLQGKNGLQLQILHTSGDVFLVGEIIDGSELACFTGTIVGEWFLHRPRISIINTLLFASGIASVFASLAVSKWQGWPHDARGWSSLLYVGGIFAGAATPIVAWTSLKLFLTRSFPRF